MTNKVPAHIDTHLPHIDYKNFDQLMVTVEYQGKMYDDYADASTAEFKLEGGFKLNSSIKIIEVYIDKEQVA